MKMKLFILAGYETTSSKYFFSAELGTKGRHVLIVQTVSLTWALIKLSLHLDKQDRLRAELSTFVDKDPTYEQLSNGLPYLDAVFREVLRVHPPVGQTTRYVCRYCICAPFLVLTS